MNVISSKKELVAKQREVINAMRRDGSLLSSISETLQNNGGVAKRSDIISGIISASNLSPVVARARHLTASGVRRNMLDDTLGYVSTDMKAGVHGEGAASLVTDGSGVWKLDGIIDLPRKERIYDKNSTKTKRTKAELQNRYKRELVQAYKALSDEKKQIFKSSGGTMEKAIVVMFNTGVKAGLALATF